MTGLVLGIAIVFAVAGTVCYSNGLRTTGKMLLASSLLAGCGLLLASMDFAALTSRSAQAQLLILALMAVGAGFLVSNVLKQGLRARRER